MGWLSKNRVYRRFRTAVTILAGVVRYLWLMFRARWPVWRPSPARWRRAHARTGRAIYRLATALGGGFIKLGQVLAARADFFPEEFLAPLRDLHDRVPPRPFRKLARHVERELGRPIDEVFAEVDPQPVAAASLAQVHRGRLVGGDQVAIKIQYPEVARVLPVDLASMRMAVGFARRLSRKLDLRGLAREITEFISLELDFEREAASTERVRTDFAADSTVVVPETHPECSSGRLLVMEYVDGEPLSDLERVRAAGIDLRELAEHLASVYCTMIFEHGFFHGDPHPGNILARPGGVIVLLDFGLAKELPEGFSAGVAGMIVATVSGDGARLLESARSIGFEVRSDDPRQFLELVKMMLGDYGGHYQRMLDLIQQTSFESVPTQFALIARTFIILNGLSHTLVPGERVIARAVARSLAAQLRPGPATSPASAAPGPASRAEEPA